MIAISDWNKLVNEARIDETNGNHKWICCVGVGLDRKFCVLSDVELNDSAKKVTKLSLSQIISISHQLVDKKSVSFFDLNPFHGLFHPFLGFKKNYQLGLLGRVRDIVLKEIKWTNWFQTKKDEAIATLSSSLLHQLEPLQKEGAELQQIFQNVLKMAERGEEKRKKAGESFFSRAFTWIKSVFCTPSTQQIKERLNKELQGAKIPRDMACANVYGYTFELFKKEGAKFTLEEFASEFIEKKLPLDTWCLLNGLAPLRELASIYQTVWNKLQPA